MTVTINQSFDCTQRELVVDIARAIYATHGFRLPEEINYLFKSQHPTEKYVLAAAEEIFYGDSPSYDDDLDEEGGV